MRNLRLLISTALLVVLALATLAPSGPPRLAPTIVEGLGGSSGAN